MGRFNLQRFVDAQAPVWEDVRAELGRARKRTHWMWFVFPQLAALGRSSAAKFYGISGIDEARAYLEHPLLGPRLLECCDLLLRAKGVSAREVFGDGPASRCSRLRPGKRQSSKNASMLTSAVSAIR
jgi:uncharacterized protein (DUF1810 family)